jgi:hypothetical protein
VVLAVNQIPVFGANAGARLRNGQFPHGEEAHLRRLEP